MKDNNYKVVQAKRPVRGGFSYKWNIVKQYIPLYEVNQWLDDINKINTGRRYAYGLINYLNFLDKINRRYEDVVSKKVIYGYIKNVLYGDEDNIVSIEPQICYSTLAGSVSAIKSFYKWLDEEKYREIIDGDFVSYIMENYSLKSSRYYLKVYSDAQVDAMASHFLTLRDRIIFLITCEGGCRIDEVLSLKYEDYDGINCEIYISKSKTLERTIGIPAYLCKEIDNYIATERQKVEIDLGILEYLFINLRKGVGYGKQLSYRNYDTILKNCAVRTGFNPKLIVTHSGRHTQVTNLLNHQSLYPNDGVTDVYIKDRMGWNRIESLKPYKHELSTKVGRKIVDEKIKERSRR